MRLSGAIFLSFVLSSAGLDDFDVAPDGRFLFFKPTTPRPDAPHVIVNWFETPKRPGATATTR